jgi:uncharacterized RDD family membrane protein YckC
MTNMSEDYIGRVLAAMPRGLSTRREIAMELGGHIAERMASGQAEADVLRQLGDPVTLAESYLSAEPLESASFFERVQAKLLDVSALLLALSPIAWVCYQIAPPEAKVPAVLVVFMIGGSFGYGIYTVIAEYAAGQTIGKRLMDLWVVRETGVRISFGQSIVRQLPLFLQVYLVDVMFALFTDKRQRAFELLSKTRVVRAHRQSSNDATSSYARASL